ncbi:MAG: endolytic transglycosylase MltG, partial [bacterium]
MWKTRYRWPWYVVIALLIVWLLFFLSSRSAEAPPITLTTNVDLASKTIRALPEDSILTEPKDQAVNQFSRFFSNAYEIIVTSLGGVQNLANPQVKYVNIPSGWRKEQVANAFAKQLKWGNQEKKIFTKEGYYYPGTYLVSSNQKAADVSVMMLTRFIENIGDHYPTSTQKQVPIDMALKIASLIEREAADKNDMRLISGVIWNRYFLGMPLGIDATLQYAKGNSSNGWWPRVRPADKNIKSPYN